MRRRSLRAVTLSEAKELFYEYTRGIGLWKNEKPTLMAMEYVLCTQMENWKDANEAILDWYGGYNRSKLNAIGRDWEAEFAKKVDRWAAVGRAMGQKKRTGGFFQSKKWLDVRYKVLARDGACCACCGATPTKQVTMHVDHIKPFSKYPELAYDMDNLQVLCSNCNVGKSDKDETNWREQRAAKGGEG